MNFTTAANAGVLPQPHLQVRIPGAQARQLINFQSKFASGK
jgi:hypothetical protein